MLQTFHRCNWREREMCPARPLIDAQGCAWGKCRVCLGFRVSSWKVRISRHNSITIQVGMCNVCLARSAYDSCG